MLVIDVSWAQSLDCRVQRGMASGVGSEHSFPQKQFSSLMQPPGPWLGAQEQWPTTLLTSGPCVWLFLSTGTRWGPRHTGPAPLSEGRRTKTFLGVPQGPVGLRGEEAAPKQYIEILLLLEHEHWSLVLSLAGLMSHTCSP